MQITYMHPADQLVAYMSRIYEANLTTTSGGNLSIKDTNGDIYITPGGYDKGSLTRRDIVCVHPDGTIDGIHKPSSELSFHRKIYEANPDFNAVLHAHSPALIAFSVVRRIPSTDLFPAVYNKCGVVTMADYALTGSDELGEIIAAQFKKGCDITILENHGLVAGGTSMEDAYLKFEALEFGAEIERRGLTLGKLNHPMNHELANKQAVRIFTGTIKPPLSSKEMDARNQICDFLHRAYRQKLICGAWGSASIRLDETSFVLTPKDVDRMTIEPQDLIYVSDLCIEENKIADEYACLHMEIYKKHPEVKSILIGQPQSLMAFAVTDTPMNTRLIPESYMVLQDLSEYDFDSYFAKPQKVAACMNHDETLLLLKNDAAVAVGPTLLRAFDRLEVAEYSAKAILSARSLGEIVEINHHQIQELRDKFHIR
ncbi:class II aldolase/adducin family protein [Eubacterium oxidoreducens]|uniref:L-fuculose-phosphate aldolase n=1 Tax=Eubacterium oxidoreducens TaxID=1732 RepID=A0A1G6BM16_EUBOX|nr:class II aldolase/adducin family protein [Eubacterium oxidoreducens]SDB21659.1 L-fuculose-phosphate aldolase [Eubacterium oxidoreducens]